MDPQHPISMKIVSRARPGIHEKRRDAEPRVYCELPSFPSFDEPAPPEASLEEVCSEYPNHLRGSYLDAFIQWHWSGTDMYTCLTETAINEFKAFGITTSKTFANRANFLMKRLDARLSALSADEVTALCTAPKIRPCMMDGTEKYGASKLQGKFHNPNAPAVRRYPHRHRGGRSPRASALTRTLVHNNQEYQLWNSARELQGYSQSMATYWGYQRAHAEQIINADAKYRASEDIQRNRLILKMTNWPCNAATETFFSFQHIQDCPTFENAIFDLVVAAVTDMMDSFPPGDTAQKLQLARQSAVSYVLAGQEARLARLKDVLTALRAGQSTGSLVDQVLLWNTGFGREVSDAAEPDLVPGNSLEQIVHSFDQSDLGPERTPHAGVPVAPFPKSSKRERPDATAALQPAKRVRFADTTTEFAPADFCFEELQQNTEAAILYPDWDLGEHHTTPAIREEAFFTPDPPVQEMLEEFDLESLPLNPLQSCLDVPFDLAQEDYSAVFEENDPEWARLFSEAATQHDVVQDIGENEMTTAWELPELVDNDPDWLTEAIANASESHDNEIAMSWELPELVNNDPDWLREAIANASEGEGGFS